MHGWWCFFRGDCRSVLLMIVFLEIPFDVCILKVVYST